MNFYRKQNKYRNIPTIVDNITFSSKKEATVYQDLKILEKQGIIQNLELQKKFAIVPKIKGVKGSRVRYYIADFVYKNAEGRVFVEDVKGKQTPVYRIKKKLMLYFHKIRIKET